jgi:hypothetical protein
VEILAGFIIALAIGITGVGAGTITAPILILFFHQSASDAVTAALIFGTVVKLIATPIYMSRGQVNLKVLKLMALGGLPAAIIGSLLLNAFDKSSLTRPILLIVGITVVISAAGTLWRSLSAAGITSKPLSSKWIPWIIAPIGFEVGFSSAGAGALGTVALMRFTSLLPAEVVGTDLAFGLLLSASAGSIHAGLTGVPWPILTKLLMGGVPGVIIGTQLTKVLSPRKMRLALCVWLLYIGGELSWRAVKPTPNPTPVITSAPNTVGRN